MIAQIKDVVKHLTRTNIATIVYALFFLFAYLIIPMTSPNIYVSPDETANHFFAQQFISSRRLWYTETLNLDAFDRIHPRSTESSGGIVVPSGFFGISLVYGVIGIATHPLVIHILTACIALLASWILYTIVAKFFNQRTAYLSWVLLLMHPAWWYYASRPWHHSILFVSLLLCSAGCVLIRPLFTYGRASSISRSMDDIASCLFFFLSILIRPSELLWLVPTLLTLYWLVEYETRRTIRLLLASAFFVALAVAGITYNIFSFSVVSSSISSLQQTDSSFVHRIFPNGISLLSIFRNVFWYFGIKVWMFTVFLLVGCFVVIKENRSSYMKLFQSITNSQTYQFTRRAMKSPQSIFAFGPHAETRLNYETTHIARYLVFFVMSSIILLVWYGSWRIVDNPDGQYITLANSYMRYWLPIFVMSIPFVAIGMQRVSELLHYKHALSFLLVIMFVFSTYMVMSGRDGIPNVIAQIRENYVIHKKVLAIVEENAVIITNRHDKLFFPVRRVMFPLDDPGTFESMNVLKSVVPLYVYDVKMSDDAQELYRAQLKDFGFTMKNVAEFDNEVLYALTPFPI